MQKHLGELAELRMRIFRDFPYLYEGSLEYEKRYLQHYASIPRSLLVVVRDGERTVGATTAMPLSDYGETALAAFRTGTDILPDSVYYFGESILLPEYRGRGIGNRFFDVREQEAIRLGFRTTSFCAVDRPDDHPLRPPHYEPLAPFWTRRGYERRADIAAIFHWRDIDESAESPKTMTFWVKRVGELRDASDGGG